MAQSPEGKSRRIVELSAPAEEDRLLIYLYTEQQWGSSQAALYDDFLREIMQLLAENPASAPIVPGSAPLRMYIARWRNARQGHRILFLETEFGIRIVRILHTAMNWSAQF